VDGSSKHVSKKCCPRVKLYRSVDEHSDVLCPCSGSHHWVGLDDRCFSSREITIHGNSDCSLYRFSDCRQVGSFVIQSFVVSLNEFSKEEPYLEHNLTYTRSAYYLDEIKEKEHPGNDSLDEEMVKRNELTVNNVRL